MTWGFAFPQHRYLNMIVEHSSKIFHRAFIYVSHNSIFTAPQILFTVVPQIPIHLCKQIPPYSKTFLIKIIEVRMCYMYLLLLYYKHIIKTKTFFIR